MTKTVDRPGVIVKAGIWFGWFGLEEPNEIQHILLSLQSVIIEIPWVMVTCIDSGRGKYVKELFGRFQYYTPSPVSPQFLGEGSLLLSVQDFYRVAFDLLSDFSEVWFFATKPEEEPPRGVALTSEGIIINTPSLGRQQAILSWLPHSGCVLGLGDGAGINFATPRRNIAEALIGTITNPNNKLYLPAI